MRQGRPPAAFLWLLLLPLLLLVACAQQASPPYGGNTIIGNAGWAPTHYYPPPGPPEDPWGPYIHEAAARYGVPEQWIRAVMQQESGGEEQAVSPVGAMGLMQVMPETYEGLRERYGLGADPYDPHNNILAGAAYIREMYDQFGAPGFLAAYNAGPDRVSGYLSGAADLPDETVHYLAAVTPNLGGSVPLSGPFLTYASARSRGSADYRASVASLAAGCNLNLAYDPAHPCTTLERAAVTSAPPAPLVAQLGAGGCNLNIAYDPSHPCSSLGAAPIAVASAASPPSAPVEPVVAAAAVPPPPPVQVAAVSPPAPVQVAAGSPPPLPASPQAAPPPMQSAPAPAAPQLAAAPASPEVSLAAAPSPLGPVAADQRRGAGCDPNLAYDPDHPCSPPPPQPAASYTRLASADEPIAPPPARPRDASARGGSAAHLLAIPERDWAIQVGAFANPRLARAVAENARAQAPGQLRAATLALPPTPNAGSVLYRARLAHLSASAASDACWQLNQRQLPCVVVQPSRT